MELIPIVEIIQVHRIFESRGVVLQPRRGEDVFASVVIMIIPADRGVEFFDIALIQLYPGLLLDPVLELYVAGTVVFEEIERFLTIQSKPIKNHLVVAFAAAWIASGEFAACFQ